MATLSPDATVGHAVAETASIFETTPALAPLLVATDGSLASDEALLAAQAIARQTGQRVELLAVHEPLPLLGPEVHLAESPAQEAESRSALRVRVLEQLMRLNVETRWPIDVVSGQPAATIARAAHRMGASLVIMGLGEHGLYERLLGDEMVLRVIRLGTVPVLAVAPGFLDLPARVLAATDFSESSVRGVRLAESMMREHSTLTLAHVVSGDTDAANSKRVNAPFHGTIGRAFDRISATLPRADVAVHREIIAGDPATALLERGTRMQADLIVTGSHGHGFLTRLWLGSVSQQLVRGARCSVLVAPPADLPSYVDELPSATTKFASYEWAERLEEFTRRNEGRLASMEIVDPDFGAQIENRGMPFLGADFDPRDASVHIMLGDATLAGRQLTRSIRNVTAVQVLRETQDRDLMLRIAHGSGQTLLTLERND
jgi:nucleotide-binding universal stress UspA family protein